jgi:hypothetical protein
MRPVEYYKGWPSKCQYNDDLNWACSIGIKYLKQISPTLKSKGITGLVVFDIDDTFLFCDESKIVGVKEMEIASNDLFILPPNVQVIELAKAAKSLDMKVVALTARPAESKTSCIVNLKWLGIPFDALIMNENDADPSFKTKIRKDLEKDPKKIIVLTIGDKITDCILPGRAAAIKLPCEDSLGAYVYIP